LASTGTLGRCQVVRRLTLDQVIGGSNPPAPAKSRDVALDLKAKRGRLNVPAGDIARDSAVRLTAVLVAVGVAILCSAPGLAAHRRAMPRVPLPSYAVPVAAVPAPGPLFTDYLWSPDTDLSIHVGLYGDCSGRTPLTHAEVAIDSCVTGQGPYFVGHGLPGLFAGLLNLSVGDSIYWYNAEGRLTVYTVNSLLTLPWNRVGYVPGSAATFQTCINGTGLVDRLVAVSAPAVGHPGILTS
jgi:hypothetical protein